MLITRPGELPHFVVGVTGTKQFDDAGQVARSLSRLLANRVGTHDLILHTGTGTAADRAAREFAETRRWTNGVTQVCPPGTSPQRVCLRTIAGFMAYCDAVILFADGGVESRFAAWLSERVGIPLRVVGPRKMTSPRGVPRGEVTGRFGSRQSIA